MSSHQPFQLPRRWKIFLTGILIIWILPVIWMVVTLFGNSSSKQVLPDDVSQKYEVLARRTFNLSPNQCELGGIKPYPVDHAIGTSQSIILVCGNKIDGRVVSTFP